MDDKIKILLCEDDENLGMLLREYLQAKGFVAELCADGEAGFKAFLKPLRHPLMTGKEPELFFVAFQLRGAAANRIISRLTGNTFPRGDLREGEVLLAIQRKQRLLAFCEQRAVEIKQPAGFNPILHRLRLRKVKTLDSLFIIRESAQTVKCFCLTKK